VKATICGQTVELVEGNIVEQQVDAIVNAANSRLAGGGGVDGAIHRRGGPSIMQETDRLYPDGCPTGSAVISGAGNLPAKHVLHAVGPVWSGGTRGEPELLASVHRRCLELALEHQCRSIAFPAISTGIYGYPAVLAAGVALRTVREFLEEHGQPELVRFVLFDARAYKTFAQALAEIAPAASSLRA
jgi:O-acetyl-ADP-ribose deacetylase (regulator of RNase III)